MTAQAKNFLTIVRVACREVRVRSRSRRAHLPWVAEIRELVGNRWIAHGRARGSSAESATGSAVTLATIRGFVVDPTPLEWASPTAEECRR